MAEAKTVSSTYGELQELTLENVFDSSQERIFLRSMNVFLEKDGYVYSYRHGESNIECYSIQTGEAFKVPVSKKLLAEIESYEDNYKFYYHISLNKDGTTVFLSYFPQKKQLGEGIESTSANIVLSFRDANSLADMKDFIQKNFVNQSTEISPELAGIGIVRAEAQLILGNGYSSVILRDSHNYYMVITEDYRDGTFTLYRYEDSIDALFQIYDDPALPVSVQFRKALSDEANLQKTKQQYSALPLKEAMYDYAELYTQGKLDNTQVSRAVFNRIVKQKAVTQFSIGEYSADDAPGGSEREDMTALYRVMEVISKHPQQQDKDLTNFSLYRDPSKLKNSDTRYCLSFHIGDFSRDIILGRDANRKPFLCYSEAYYYDITEQEYIDLRKQCQEALLQGK